MSVHEKSAGKTATRQASVAKQNWRKDWERMPHWPEYDATGQRWSILALTMLAVHNPSSAAFQLEYGDDHLLHSVKFLSRWSGAPSLNWKPNGPEMRQLISQITHLYLRRW